MKAPTLRTNPVNVGHIPLLPAEAVSELIEAASESSEMLEEFAETDNTPIRQTIVNSFAFLIPLS
jgi:hypothetical protein